MTKHLTDRKDWTFVSECSEHGEDHLRIEASARAAGEDYQNPEDLFPVDECLECGAPMAWLKKDEWTEVLD